MKFCVSRVVSSMSGFSRDCLWCPMTFAIKVVLVKAFLIRTQDKWSDVVFYSGGLLCRTFFEKKNVPSVVFIQRAARRKVRSARLGSKRRSWDRKRRRLEKILILPHFLPTHRTLSSHLEPIWALSEGDTSQKRGFLKLFAFEYKWRWCQWGLAVKRCRDLHQKSYVQFHGHICSVHKQ